MKQKIILLALFLTTFLITGCISIYFDLHVNSDGSGRIEITYDFEEMMSMMDDVPEDQRFSPQDACEEFYEDRDDFEEEIGFEGFECEAVGNKMIVSTNVERDKIKIETNTDGTYTLRVTPEDEMYTLFENLLDDDGLGDEMGMSVVYTIHFEGEVVETNIGQKQGNKVIIDVSQGQPDFTDVVIIARQASGAERSEATGSDSQGINITSQQTIIGGIILAIIIIVIILLFVKKKQNQVEIPQNLNQTQEQKPEKISPTVKKLIDWIHQYQEQYPEKTLRETLEKSKEYTDYEIEQAFKNK